MAGRHQIKWNAGVYINPGFPFRKFISALFVAVPCPAHKIRQSLRALKKRFQHWHIGVAVPWWPWAAGHWKTGFLYLHLLKPPGKNNSTSSSDRCPLKLTGGNNNILITKWKSKKGLWLTWKPRICDTTERACHRLTLKRGDSLSQWKSTP